MDITVDLDRGFEEIVQSCSMLQQIEHWARVSQNHELSYNVI
ncbi:ParD-like family protein [Wolbachia endosymbiont of Brugia malayi]|nr:ParD-like family protein [Wolbachia endosymbiont of Brugia malayi]